MKKHHVILALASCLMVSCAHHDGLSDPSSGSSPIQRPLPQWQREPTHSAPLHKAEELSVNAVRIGEHKEYDRVVVDLLDGNAADTTWQVEYVNPDDHGDIAKELGGETYLALTIRGVRSTHTSRPAGAVEESDIGILHGVYLGSVVDDEVSVFIGLDKQREFRVLTLESPARIVIDIHH